MRGSKIITVKYNWSINKFIVLQISIFRLAWGKRSMNLEETTSFMAEAGEKNRRSHYCLRIIVTKTNWEINQAVEWANATPVSFAVDLGFCPSVDRDKNLTAACRRRSGVCRKENFIQSEAYSSFPCRTVAVSFQNLDYIFRWKLWKLNIKVFYQLDFLLLWNASLNEMIIFKLFN